MFNQLVVALPILSGTYSKYLVYANCVIFLFCFCCYLENGILLTLLDNDVNVVPIWTKHIQCEPVSDYLYRSLSLPDSYLYALS